MNFSSVVFDLDGTLVDASPDITAALNTAFRPLGVRQLAPEEVRRFLGGGPHVLVQKSLKALDCALDEDQAEKVFHDYTLNYRLNPVKNTRFLGDSKKALFALHATGTKLGVCTNKRTDVAERVLSELNVGELFQAVVGSDSVSHNKPHPGHLLWTLDLLESKPSESLYIGDTQIDAQTAVAAGVAYAQVPWADELAEPHAGGPRISNLIDIVKLVGDYSKAAIN